MLIPSRRPVTKGDPVPDHARVLRYAGERKWNDQFKENNWRAFELSQNSDGSLERGLSIYWHEIFPGSLEDQLDQVRLRTRLRFGQLAHLLEIPVAIVVALLHDSFDDEIYATLQFVRDPLRTKMGFRRDKTYGRILRDGSHCLFKGIELLDEQLRTAIAQLLVCAVTREHPARKRPVRA